MTKSNDSMHACSISTKGMSRDIITKLTKRLTTLGYSVKAQSELGRITKLYIHLFMHVVREVDCIYIEDKVDSINLASWVADNGGSVSICL